MRNAERAHVKLRNSHLRERISQVVFEKKESKLSVEFTFFLFVFDLRLIFSFFFCNFYSSKGCVPLVGIVLGWSEEK